jgi:hypothetical protein
VAYFSPVGVTTKFVMISIDDFKVASFEKKCDLVTSQTTYITSRCDEEKKIYLYHSGKFFIEVFYSPLFKRVLLIHAFNDLNNLLPYAESVSLEDLKL